MKKLFLTTSVCVLSFVAAAQTEKGQGLWTGSFSFSQTAYKQNFIGYRGFFGSSVSQLSVDRGIFFKDNWLVGGGIDATWLTSRSFNLYPYQTNPAESKTLGVFVHGLIRRYWGQDKWRVFLGGGLSLGYSLNDYEYSTQPDANTFTVSPVSQVGANYYLTNRIGLEASVSSTSFPFEFKGLNIGLVLLTGGDKSKTVKTFEASQTAKGRWVLGGSFNFNTSKTGDDQSGIEQDRTNSFAISPSVGWFIKKNLVLGVGVPFENRWDSTHTATLLGVAPYLKKYFTDNRIRPFLEGSLSYLLVRNKARALNSFTTSSSGIAASAGLAYLLGDRFIIEAVLAGATFNQNYHPKEPAARSSTITALVSLQPNFLITYVFN